MRKLAFLSVCLLACLSVHAQDIIVKADGTTIPAKVLNVTSTDVQYKKASNPEGPTYVVPVIELISINYENGEKDVFNNAAAPNQEASTPTPNYNPNIVTNETASQFSDDRRLLSIYYSDSPDVESLKKKGKVWKIVGIAGGIVIVGVGILHTINVNSDRPEEDKDSGILTGAVIAGGGVALGTTCFLIGNNYCNKAKKLANSLVSTPILESELDFSGGRNLRLGVDMMTCNLPNTRQFNPGIGVGVRYTF